MTSNVWYAIWALCAAWVLVLWGLARRQASGLARPSAVAGSLMARPVTRVVVGLGYMWLGWHLFAR